MAQLAQVEWQSYRRGRRSRPCRKRIRLRNVAYITRETELDLAGVGGAGGADPLRGAGLLDAEALGEDR
jgi:hypothetical protein